jgi:hypothetical protein
MYTAVRPVKMAGPSAGAGTLYAATSTLSKRTGSFRSVSYADFTLEAVRRRCYIDNVGAIVADFRRIIAGAAA